MWWRMEGLTPPAATTSLSTQCLVGGAGRASSSLEGKLVQTFWSQCNIIFMEENFGRTITHLGHHKEVLNAIIMKTSYNVLFRIVECQKELKRATKWPTMKYPRA